MKKGWAVAVLAVILAACWQAGWLPQSLLPSGEGAWSERFTTVALLLLGALGYRLLFGPPASRTKKEVVGKGPRPSASKERERTYATIPPYPNGWYKVANSTEVKKGQILEVECLSLSLVVFRGEDGKACVADAHCPHMGANLAYGGKVVGNCIECPFHRWQFDTSGKCTKIPYSESIPEIAKLKTYEVVEYYGTICIYYDAEGRPAPYLPPSIPEMDTFVYRGTYTQDVGMHIQEFAENSADFQHFDPLHGNMMIPFTETQIPGMKIVHKADWIPGKAEEGMSHIAYFKDSAYLTFLGKEIPRTQANAVITFVGPAGIVFFTFYTPLGNIVLFQTHLPLKPMLQKVQFMWYADPKIPRLLVSYVVGNWIAQWRRDIMVWENKVWAIKPLLVKGDGPVMKLRRWFQQFYSENSFKVLEDQKCSLLDW